MNPFWRAYFSDGVGEPTTNCGSFSLVEGVVGLSVEPVEEHFHQLPVKEGQAKLRAAVAEEDGEAELYVVKPDSWYEKPKSGQIIATSHEFSPQMVA